MSYNIPEPTPETQRFWDDAKENILTIPFCLDTNQYFFYPRSFSPYTGSRNVEWRSVSGVAYLHSYIINYRGLKHRTVASPIIATVRLKEGPVMMSNIVDINPDHQLLKLDMPLQVKFHKISENISLPVFAPSQGMS